MKKCPYCGNRFNFWQFWWNFGFMASADNPLAQLTMFTEHNTCPNCKRTFILSYPKEKLKKSARKLVWILAIPVPSWFILKNFISHEVLFITTAVVIVGCMGLFLWWARYLALEFEVDPNPIRLKQENKTTSEVDRKRMLIVWIIIGIFVALVSVLLIHALYIDHLDRKAGCTDAQKGLHPQLDSGAYLQGYLRCRNR